MPTLPHCPNGRASRRLIAQRDLGVLDELPPTSELAHGPGRVQPFEKERPVACKVAGELTAPAARELTRLQQCLGECGLGIRDPLHVASRRQTERTSSRRASSHGTNCSLVEEQPGLGHPRWHDRHDRHLDTTVSSRRGNFGAPKTRILAFGVSMNEHDVDRHTLIDQEFESAENGVANPREVPRVDRSQSDGAPCVGADPLQVSSGRSEAPSARKMPCSIMQRRRA